MCNSKNVKLVIIDSVAGVVRSEFDHHTDGFDGKTENRADYSIAGARTTFLFQLSSKLKWLASTYKVAIVVVNQVTAYIENQQYIELNGFEDESINKSRIYSYHLNPHVHNITIPSLGLAWSHCVNTRIMLTKAYVGASHPTPVRKLHLCSSNIKPPGHCTYTISDDGIHGGCCEN